MAINIIRKDSPRNVFDNIMFEDMGMYLPKKCVWKGGNTPRLKNSSMYLNVHVHSFTNTELFNICEC